MKLTPQQWEWLRWLAQVEDGYVDRYGRIVIEGFEPSDMSAQTPFLKLLAAGLITGANGRVRVTDNARTIIKFEDSL